jgi:rRNA maturation RNase YbeY
LIIYNYETDFNLNNETVLTEWISNTILKYNYTLGEVNYIFCDDNYLHKLNVEFLNHDTLTDIISFDNTVGKLVSGDIFISIERVKENAIDFNVSYEEELHRVMIHGVLHYLGFKDKSDEDKKAMRNAENDALFVLNN